MPPSDRFVHMAEIETMAQILKKKKQNKKKTKHYINHLFVRITYVSALPFHPV